MFCSLGNTHSANSLSITGINFLMPKTTICELKKKSAGWSNHLFLSIYVQFKPAKLIQLPGISTIDNSFTVMHHTQLKVQNKVFKPNKQIRNHSTRNHGKQRSNKSGNKHRRNKHRSNSWKEKKKEVLWSCELSPRVLSEGMLGQNNVLIPHQARPPVDDSC